MAIIAFIGAGSTVFAKNVLGDSMYVESLKNAHIRLIDVDGQRLEDSAAMVQNLGKSLDANIKVETFSSDEARYALSDVDYVVNAIQVGGYDPCTKIDFEIPKKFGLEQTIGDTLGIGGIFRGLRTIPPLLEYCRILEDVAPDAWLLNYTNPMCIVTGAVLRATGVKTVGLCHSVQACATHLCNELDLPSDDLVWNIAGINHQAWLLEISRYGEDLYPEIKRRAELPEYFKKDAVRFEVMKRFNYYVTESSEHTSEYVPWFIKKDHPELIERFHIPLDEYPRRCIAQIDHWKHMREELVTDKPLQHERGHEYASYILEAMETDKPFTIAGNVLNKGYITNLPTDACVEVKCVVDANGITPCHVGALPPQCAALNLTNINVQEMTIQAALTGKKDHIYQAALLDPHTAAELTIDEIVALCDALIEAHGDWLPKFH